MKYVWGRVKYKHAVVAKEPLTQGDECLNCLEYKYHICGGGKKTIEW